MKHVGNQPTDTKVSFYSRKNNTRSVFLEGFANRFKENGELLVDRGNDLIQPAGWDLKNFQSNGIILFNHDRDNPVGRAIKVEKNEEGLFVKAKMSDSDHPEISRVRDLVKDGVLKAFSVGFNPKQTNEEKINGKTVNMIIEAELLEISIVSLPMAERSLFNVTAKTLATLPYGVAVKACMGDLTIYEDDGETMTNEAVQIIDKTIKTLKDAEIDAETPDPDQVATTVDEQPPEEAASIIDSQPKEVPTSPLLDQIKQTNILLSNLISEIQLMSQKLDGLVTPEAEEAPPEPPAEEAPAETPPEEASAPDLAEEESKKLKLVDDMHLHCDKILRKYGY